MYATVFTQCNVAYVLCAQLSIVSPHCTCTLTMRYSQPQSTFWWIENSNLIIVSKCSQGPRHVGAHSLRIKICSTCSPHSYVQETARVLLTSRYITIETIHFACYLVEQCLNVISSTVTVNMRAYTGGKSTTQPTWSGKPCLESHSGSWCNTITCILLPDKLQLTTPLFLLPSDPTLKHSAHALDWGDQVLRLVRVLKAEENLTMGVISDEWKEEVTAMSGQTEVEQGLHAAHSIAELNFNRYP